MIVEVTPPATRNTYHKNRAILLFWSITIFVFAKALLATVVTLNISETSDIVNNEAMMNLHQ